MSSFLRDVPRIFARKKNLPQFDNVLMQVVDGFGLRCYNYFRKTGGRV